MSIRDRIRDCILDYVHKDELEGVVNHINYYVRLDQKIVFALGIIVGIILTIIGLKWIS
jgi:hypothetical protein